MASALRFGYIVLIISEVTNSCVIADCNFCFEQDIVCSTLFRLTQTEPVSVVAGLVTP